MKTWLATVIIGVLALPAFAQKHPAATKPQDAITYFFDALSELDEAKLRAYVTNDFLLLEVGEVWNTDSLANSISRRKGRNFTRKNYFRYIRTEQMRNDATVAYFNRADITLDGRPIVVEWLESAHLVRVGKGWKIKMMHSTRLEEGKN